MGNKWNNNNFSKPNNLIRILIVCSITVNTDTIKKNTNILTDASKRVGIEVNTEKTKYMLLSRH
jgi:hypothetical protein